MLGIYCRTSKAREDKYTLETQKANGIKCAEQLNLDYFIYVDDGISGTKDENDREGLATLFSDMKKGIITAVYCIDQARIERGHEIWEVFSVLCLSNDVKYYPGGSFFDLEDPALMMSARIVSLTNKFYTQQTSIKVKDANARKAALGKTHGLKAYGFKKGEGNNYEIDENEAKYVRIMFQMSISGVGSYRIANYLNDQNIPTKFSGNFKDKGVIKRRNKYTKELVEFKKKEVKWRGNVIGDILKNPIYKGDRIWNVYKNKEEIIDGKKVKSKVLVETITGKVPKIVSEELWERVQKNFQKNKKESVGKKAHYHYLLNGLVFCERCGNKYWGKKRLKGNDNAYKCLSKVYPNPKCDNRGLSLPKLETFVLQYLQRKPLSSQVIKALPIPFTFLDKNKELRAKKQTELAQISNSIKNITSQLDKSNRIKEVLDKLTSMNNRRDFLIEDISVLDKKIADEELINPNAEIIKQGRRKLSMLPKINAEFLEIQKTVFQLVDWISIEYINNVKPAFYKIKIKLKGLQYIDEYMVDFHLNEWKQAGYYISKVNSKGIATVNISRSSDFDLKEVLRNLKPLSPSEAKRSKFNNYFSLKDSDIYKFD